MKAVLIVDDQESIRALLRERLLRATTPPPQILKAGDVEAARSLAAAIPEPGITVIDWNMLLREPAIPKSALRVSDQLARELIADGWDVFRFSGEPGNIPADASNRGAFGRGELRKLVEEVIACLD